MKQIYTILFDLDGTLVDTAPDLMMAHNHVMKKFGYQTKTTEEIRDLVGQGAGALIGRSIWGQAKKEFGKVQDQKIKDKALMKLKEVKSRSDDQGSKSKQYLEALVKIPFGIFRKEPILCKMEGLNEIFKNVSHIDGGFGAIRQSKFKIV